MIREQARKPQKTHSLYSQGFHPRANWSKVGEVGEVGREEEASVGAWKRFFASFWLLCLQAGWKEGGTNPIFKKEKVV